MALPVFDGENDQVWAMRMKAYLDARDLWEAVEEDYEGTPLPGNPTMAQIKTHKEKKIRKSKAKARLFAAVSPTIFRKIVISKDVQFLEHEQWDWNEESQVKHQIVPLDPDELENEQPVRGTRSLSDIYQRCNFTVFKPAGYEEAKADQRWIDTMKEELAMIEKN
ncbi:hypothetical protein GH714_020333 [Hevea brasiliensis]|uniref:DUF4219 domain-containing protein n=1 Tax=Hevea brasiliensis TaxID=3981 RepID=A0A6A6K678_HEVBR|nr:hypothetical protein GH714_020333 [Hevea brasiliensis]